MSNYKATVTDMRRSMINRGYTEGQVSELLGSIKADAWDEGFAEFERGHHASNYEPWEYTEDNPYRADNLEAS